MSNVNKVKFLLECTSGVPLVIFICCIIFRSAFSHSLPRIPEIEFSAFIIIIIDVVISIIIKTIFIS